MNLNDITKELEAETQSLSKHPVFGRAAAPLRLVLVWMKAVNTELHTMREYMNREDVETVKQEG